MENTESVEKSEQTSFKAAQTRLEERFAALRQEASERAVQHRERLQRAAGVAQKSSKTQTMEDLTPREPRHGADRREVIQRVKTPTMDTKPSHPKILAKHKARRDLDLIALWSVVGPSTIAAVFAGVAMSRNHVPISYALAFIFAWFVLTSGLALSALKLFNTREFVKFLRSSSPRLGVAAVSCALVSVLAVEVARLSITAIAAPGPQQVSAAEKSNHLASRTARSDVLPTRKASIVKQAANPSSTHFPTTPNLVFPAPKQPTFAGSTDETVVALPAPIPAEPDVDQDLAEAESPKTKSPRSKGELLGRISSKGKFVAHRGSSKWSKPKNKTATLNRSKRQAAKPDNRNILEKFFNPVINSANAKAPERKIGSEKRDLDQISR